MAPRYMKIFHESMEKHIAPQIAARSNVVTQKTFSLSNDNAIELQWLVKVFGSSQKNNEELAPEFKF